MDLRATVNSTSPRSWPAGVDSEQERHLPCPATPESGWVRMSSSASSAPGAWAKSIAHKTPSSVVTSPSYYVATGLLRERLRPPSLSAPAGPIMDMWQAIDEWSNRTDHVAGMVGCRGRGNH